MKLLAAFFAAFLILTPNSVSAFRGPVAGVTVSNEGWAKTDVTGLGENHVYIDIDSINIDRAIDRQASGDLEIITQRGYTVEEIQNGTFDSERDTAYTFDSSSASTGSYAVVVKRSTLNSIPHLQRVQLQGEASFVFPFAAKDQDEQMYDIKLTIKNVEVYISTEAERKGALLLFRGRSHGVFNALQEHSASELRANTSNGQIVSYSNVGFSGGGYNGLWDGASYDTTIELFKAGTNERIAEDNSGMAMSFNDIDGADITYETRSLYTAGSTNITNPHHWRTLPTFLAAGQGGITLNRNRTGLSDRYLAQGAHPAPFAEGYEILGGLKENSVFSFTTNNESLASTNDEEGTYLYFEETAGGHLRVAGANETGSTGQPSPQTTRLLLLADARNFSYRYSGSACGSTLGFVGVKKVVTTLGLNASHLEITETDENVTWRENKTVTFAVEPGYEIPGVIIDGKSYSINAMTAAGRTAAGWRKYTYTFNDVVDDHIIEVSATPKEIFICKVDEKRSDLTGTKLSLTGLANNQPIDFTADGNNTSGITNLSTDPYKITWLYGACDGFYGLPNGSYTVTELSALPGYELAPDFHFTVLDGEIVEYGTDPFVLAPNEIEIIDAYEYTGSLRIEKRGYGNNFDLNKEFTISLTITGNEDDVYSGDYNVRRYDRDNVATDTTLAFADGTATFTLKSGEALTMTLPSGYHWHLTEADYSTEGYTVSYEEQSGRIVKDTESVAAIINTREAEVNAGVDLNGSPQLFVLGGMIAAGGLIYVAHKIRGEFV